MRVGDPDGHGRYGHLEETSEGLVCHDCGRPYRHLATHVRLSHGYTDAMHYRKDHGLKRKQRMVSRSTSDALKASYARHRDAHLAALESSRDTAAATDASRTVRTTPGEWAPAARASRQAHLTSRRGRGLTGSEREWLGDDLDMTEWCRRARVILQDPAISQTSMSRSLGLSDEAVNQRLRRYP